MGNYTIIPVFNSLSNCKAQLLTLSTSDLQKQIHQIKTVLKKKLTNIQYLISLLTEATKLGISLSMAMM